MAVVARRANGDVQVHYKGYDAKYDEWVPEGEVGRFKAGRFLARAPNAAEARAMSESRRLFLSDTAGTDQRWWSPFYRDKPEAGRHPMDQRDAMAHFLTEDAEAAVRESRRRGSFQVLGGGPRTELQRLAAEAGRCRLLDVHATPLGG